MYRGKRKFDREQLIFVAELIFAGAFDRIESGLPDTVPLDEYKARKKETLEYIHGCKCAVAMQLPILYAQLTDDGMGTGDFPAYHKFEKMVDAFLKERTKPGFKLKPGDLCHPDCRKLAEGFVDDSFGDYLKKGACINPVIKAEVHSDDHHVTAQFDALDYFLQASDEDLKQLAECEYGGDYPADAVAEHFEENDEVAHVFQYARDAGLGFECNVDKTQAEAWIAANRPSLSDQLA